MTASHSSSPRFASIRSRRKPALLTSTSSRPNAVERGGDEPLRAGPVGDVVGVRDGPPAGGDDLVDDLLGRPVGASVPSSPTPSR